MSQTLQLDTPNGAVTAYLAEPRDRPKGGLVVLQEIFGVNAHIRSVADTYARMGYLAIAPALFDPIERDVELGYDAEGIARGRELVEALGFARAIASVACAAEVVAKAGKVATVGYCWGGSVAYLAAIELGLPGISYYGGRNVQWVDRPAKAPLMFHYGERDAHISGEDRAKVAAANPDAPIHLYAADHGFNCDQRDSYDAPSAKLALERSLEFLAKQLG